MFQSRTELFAMAEYLNVPNRTLFTGDNLPVLRGINTDAVDLVYLDPPRNRGRTQSGRKYNGKTITYEDTWTTDNMRAEWSDEISIRCPDALLAIDTARVLHSAEMAGYLTYMAIRLLELRRVLKPSGSIYLQCDPHTVHYQRAVMDSVFGSENFKNEISWRRDRICGIGTMRWAWHHDTLLFYAGPHKYHWNLLTQEPPPEYWATYTHMDENGLRYYTAPLVAQGRRSDDSGEPWGQWDPGEIGRHWAPPVAPLKHLHPDVENWDAVSAQEKLTMLVVAGLVHYGGSRFPRFRRYEDSASVTAIQDIITTVPAIRRRDEQDQSWPEQKPEGLLDYIIRASSHPRDPLKKTEAAAEADILLDPFAGSGTSCMVAERLGRRWIGIEKDEQAGKILRRRLTSDSLTERVAEGLRVTAHPPERTDLKAEAAEPDYHGMRSDLYRRQKGRCRGCNHSLPAHVLVTDRIRYPGRAEADSLDNLMLVCHHCRALRLRGPVSQAQVENFERGIYSGETASP